MHGSKYHPFKILYLTSCPLCHIYSISSCHSPTPLVTWLSTNAPISPSISTYSPLASSLRWLSLFSTFYQHLPYIFIYFRFIIKSDQEFLCSILCFMFCSHGCLRVYHVRQILLALTTCSRYPYSSQYMLIRRLFVAHFPRYTPHFRL